MNTHLLWFCLVSISILCLYLAKRKTFDLWMPNKFIATSVLGGEMLSPKIQHVPILLVSILTTIHVLSNPVITEIAKELGKHHPSVTCSIIATFAVCYGLFYVVTNTLIKLWIKIERPGIRFDLKIRPVIKTMA